MTNPNETTEMEIAEDLVFEKTEPRKACGGTWTNGTLNGHRFSALVFPEHADTPEYEIGESRISKLWLQRLSDKKMVYNWDRGLDVPPADERAQEIVRFLCEGLAFSVYGD